MRDEPQQPVTRRCTACQQPLPPNAPGGLCPACLLRRGIELVSASRLKPGIFVLPADEELALLFPEFEIAQCLGHGGMGAVYKAVQRELDRTVAIKILPPESAGDPEFIERFRREAATLAHLDHPNIVKLFDYGQREEFAYFVMEYVDGMDLARQLAAARAPMSAPAAFQIVSQLCDALQHSHERGIIHRDIKPANVLITPQGHVKVADFGLARLVRENGLTRTHATLGTPRYMAPEQMAGAAGTDHRVDIYAVGVMLYELLTGHLPVGHFDPPSEKVAALNPLIDEVVLRALSADPDLL
jgi:serine/threonine protein kinase